MKTFEIKYTINFPSGSKRHMVRHINAQSNVMALRMLFSGAPDSTLNIIDIQSVQEIPEAVVFISL